ncbi:MAG: FkbM family methyltransferase [Pseudomonadota bacterium]
MLKRAVQYGASRFGYRLLRESTYQSLVVRSGGSDDLDLLQELQPEFLSETLGLLTKSKAQLRQDLLAYFYADRKKSGYFVEFGATDGVEKSNTYLLEREFGWSGILAEPNRSWHQELRSKRSVKIDERCVWSEGGEELEFAECENQELATLESLLHSDLHRRSRRVINRYRVQTVTLDELLLTHQAPKFIDFLSVDTEGSEAEIIRNFDFSTWEFGFVCIEHNRRKESEDQIETTLSSNGYQRVGKAVSKFDAWFIGPSIRRSVLK